MGTFSITDEVLGSTRIAQFTQRHELDLLNSGDDEYHSMDEDGFDSLEPTDPVYHLRMDDYYRVDTSREWDEVYLRFEAYHSTRESGDLAHVIGAEYEDVQGLDRIWSNERVERGEASGNFEWHTQVIDDGEGLDFVEWLDNYGSGELHFLQTVAEGWSTGGWRVRNAEIHYPVVDNPTAETDGNTSVSVDDMEYVEEVVLRFDYERRDGNPNHWLGVHLGDQTLLNPTDLDGDSGHVETIVSPFEFEYEETTTITFTADSRASSHRESAGCEYDIENVEIEWIVNEQELTAESTPGDAAVFVDGEYVGETPHTASVSPLEEFDVRIEKDGYTTERFENVSAPKTVHADLDPEEAALEVSSSPDGADVYLDGSRVGTTPWSGDRPTTNSYDIRVEKDGYQTATRSGVSPPGTVSVELEPRSTSITVDPEPMSVGGRSLVSFSGTHIKQITVRDLWTDWTIVDREEDGGAFVDAVESDGECRFTWNSSQASVAASITVEPPEDTYREGEYALEATATAPDDSTTTVSILEIR